MCECVFDDTTIFVTNVFVHLHCVESGFEWKFTVFISELTPMSIQKMRTFETKNSIHRLQIFFVHALMILRSHTITFLYPIHIFIFNSFALSKINIWLFLQNQPNRTKRILPIRQHTSCSITSAYRWFIFVWKLLHIQNNLKESKHIPLHSYSSRHRTHRHDSKCSHVSDVWLAT